MLSSNLPKDDFCGSSSSCYHTDACSSDELVHLWDWISMKSSHWHQCVSIGECRLVKCLEGWGFQAGFFINSPFSIYLTPLKWEKQLRSQWQVAVALLPARYTLLPNSGGKWSMIIPTQWQHLYVAEGNGSVSFFFNSIDVPFWF